MDESHTWDALARRYERIVQIFDRSYPAIRKRLSDDLGGRAKVLEVAAGTGQFTLDLARVAERVVATDISPQMVARLRAAVRAAGATNVQVTTMSAYEIDAAASSFDAVFCANALHVMEQPRQALREFRRVLTSDGVLVAPTFLHGTDVARRTLSWTMSLVSPFVAHTRLDLAGLCALLEETGFTVGRREKLPGLFPIGYVVASRASEV